MITRNQKFMVLFVCILFLFILSNTLHPNSKEIESIRKISLEISNVYGKYASLIDGATLPLKMNCMAKIGFNLYSLCTVFFISAID